MNEALEMSAALFATCQPALLERWRSLVRSDSTLPERRLRFFDAELEDHLPALLDTIVQALRGHQQVDGTIRQRGATHGHSRRQSGYTIEQVIWEFAIFRKLLRETIEQLASKVAPADLFVARELVLEIVDRSEVGSIHQYVEEAGAERDAAREAMREANEQKDRFLAVLSHELRNPLAAITTAVFVAGEPGRSESERQRALEIVRRQTIYQKRLVDDLLDANRISQGHIQLKKEKVDLLKIVEDVLEVYLPAIEAKSINLRWARPDRHIELLADAQRLEQVVSNLVANALKFTGAGGSIEILLTHEPGFATITVTDSGSGIEPSGLSQIFDLFAQFQHPTDVGLGVGLWLAKNLVELHKGTVEAASEGLNTGTEITVRLPIPESTLQEKSQASRRVLVVEDDPEQRELMVMVLSDTETQVVGAKGSADAIAFASSNPFDVCILDLNLQDTTGYDLVGKLLKIHTHRRPITIALTGFGGPENTDQVKRAGFDHYLVKPADINHLRRLVRESPGAQRPKWQ